MMDQMFWSSIGTPCFANDETTLREECNFPSIGNFDPSCAQESNSPFEWRDLEDTLISQDDTTDKENQVPAMETLSNDKLLKMLLQTVATVQERMDAVEQRLSREIRSIHTLLEKLVDENASGSRENSPPPPNAFHFSHSLITASMQDAIDAAKPLKYWGECLHFVLRRPESFYHIIHWADEEGKSYWISNEEALHTILASLKGSTPQRSRESMKSRFFVKSVSEHAKRKEEGKDLVFDLYENKKPEYTPGSLHHPRVTTTTSLPNHVALDKKVKLERKRSSSSDEGEDEGGAKKRKEK